MLTELPALRGLAECDTAEALTAAVDALVRPLGVDHWLYATDLPLANAARSQFTLGGYPPAWVSRYLERGYLQFDPIVSHCHDRSTPLIWQDVQPVGRLAANPHQRRIRDIFGEANEFGLGAGISVPLHGPGLAWGLMSFASAAPSGPQLGRRLPDLHLVAHFTHEAARRFARPHLPARLPPLTRRERECLFWASQGKTSWEIGQLLVIAERTAIFHLQNAAQKLGVCGRQAAVARAVSLGMISAVPPQERLPALKG
ncbi:autoinducer binding domain-containing protein [Lysobacter olei]